MSPPYINDPDNPYIPAGPSSTMPEETASQIIADAMAELYGVQEDTTTGVDAGQGQVSPVYQPENTYVAVAPEEPDYGSIYQNAYTGVYGDEQFPTFEGQLTDIPGLLDTRWFSNDPTQQRQSWLDWQSEYDRALLAGNSQKVAELDHELSQVQGIYTLMGQEGTRPSMEGFSAYNYDIGLAQQADQAGFDAVNEEYQGWIDQYNQNQTRANAWNVAQMLPEYLQQQGDLFTNTAIGSLFLTEQANAQGLYQSNALRDSRTMGEDMISRLIEQSRSNDYPLLDALAESKARDLFPDPLGSGELKAYRDWLAAGQPRQGGHLGHFRTNEDLQFDATDFESKLGVMLMDMVTGGKRLIDWSFSGTGGPQIRRALTMPFEGAGIALKASLGTPTDMAIYHALGTALDFPFRSLAAAAIVGRYYATGGERGMGNYGEAFGTGYKQFMEHHPIYYIAAQFVGDPLNYAEGPVGFFRDAYEVQSRLREARLMRSSVRAEIDLWRAGDHALGVNPDAVKTYAFTIPNTKKNVARFNDFTAERRFMLVGDGAGLTPELQQYIDSWVKKTAIEEVTEGRWNLGRLGNDSRGLAIRQRMAEELIADVRAKHPELEEELRRILDPTKMGRIESTEAAVVPTLQANPNIRAYYTTPVTIATDPENELLQQVLLGDGHAISLTGDLHIYRGSDGQTYMLTGNLPDPLRYDALDLKWVEAEDVPPAPKSTVTTPVAPQAEEVPSQVPTPAETAPTSAGTPYESPRDMAIRLSGGVSPEEQAWVRENTPEWNRTVRNRVRADEGMSGPLVYPSDAPRQKGNRAADGTTTKGRKRAPARGASAENDRLISETGAAPNGDDLDAIQDLSPVNITKSKDGRILTVETKPNGAGPEEIPDLTEWRLSSDEPVPTPVKVPKKKRSPKSAREVPPVESSGDGISMAAADVVRRVEWKTRYQETLDSLRANATAQRSFIQQMIHHLPGTLSPEVEQLVVQLTADAGRPLQLDAVLQALELLHGGNDLLIDWLKSYDPAKGKTLVRHIMDQQNFKRTPIGKITELLQNGGSLVQAQVLSRTAKGKYAAQLEQYMKELNKTREAIGPEAIPQFDVLPPRSSYSLDHFYEEFESRYDEPFIVQGEPEFVYNKRAKGTKYELRPHVSDNFDTKLRSLEATGVGVASTLKELMISKGGRITRGDVYQLLVEYGLNKASGFQVSQVAKLVDDGVLRAADLLHHSLTRDTVPTAMTVKQFEALSLLARERRRGRTIRETLEAEGRLPLTAGTKKWFESIFGVSTPEAGPFAPKPRGYRPAQEAREAQPATKYRKERKARRALPERQPDADFVVIAHDLVKRGLIKTADAASRLIKPYLDNFEELKKLDSSVTLRYRPMELQYWLTTNRPYIEMAAPRYVDVVDDLLSLPLYMKKDGTFSTNVVHRRWNEVLYHEDTGLATRIANGLSLENPEHLEDLRQAQVMYDLILKGLTDDHEVEAIKTAVKYRNRASFRMTERTKPIDLRNFVHSLNQLQSEHKRSRDMYEAFLAKSKEVQLTATEAQQMYGMQQQMEAITKRVRAIYSDNATRLDNALIEHAADRVERIRLAEAYGLDTPDPTAITPSAAAEDALNWFRQGGEDGKNYWFVPAKDGTERRVAEADANALNRLRVRPSPLTDQDADMLRKFQLSDSSGLWGLPMTSRRQTYSQVEMFQTHQNWLKPIVEAKRNEVIRTSQEIMAARHQASYIPAEEAVQNALDWNTTLWDNHRVNLKLVDQFIPGVWTNAAAFERSLFDIIHQRGPIYEALDSLAIGYRKQYTSALVSLGMAATERFKGTENALQFSAVDWFNASFPQRMTDAAKSERGAKLVELRTERQGFIGALNRSDLNAILKNNGLPRLMVMTNHKGGTPEFAAHINRLWDAYREYYIGQNNFVDTFSRLTKPLSALTGRPRPRTINDLYRDGSWELAFKQLMSDWASDGAYFPDASLFEKTISAEEQAQAAYAMNIPVLDDLIKQLDMLPQERLRKQAEEVLAEGDVPPIQVTKVEEKHLANLRGWFQKYEGGPRTGWADIAPTKAESDRALAAATDLQARYPDHFLEEIPERPEKISRSDFDSKEEYDDALGEYQDELIQFHDDLHQWVSDAIEELERGATAAANVVEEVNTRGFSATEERLIEQAHRMGFGPRTTDPVAELPTLLKIRSDELIPEIRKWRHGLENITEGRIQARVRMQAQTGENVYSMIIPGLSKEFWKGLAKGATDLGSLLKDRYGHTVAQWLRYLTDPKFRGTLSGFVRAAYDGILATLVRAYNTTRYARAAIAEHLPFFDTLRHDFPITDEALEGLTQDVMSDRPLPFRTMSFEDWYTPTVKDLTMTSDRYDERTGQLLRLEHALETGEAGGDIDFAEYQRLLEGSGLEGKFKPKPESDVPNWVLGQDNGPMSPEYWDELEQATTNEADEFGDFDVRQQQLDDLAHAQDMSLQTEQYYLSELANNNEATPEDYQRLQEINDYFAGRSDRPSLNSPFHQQGFDEAARRYEASQTPEPPGWEEGSRPFGEGRLSELQNKYLSGEELTPAEQLELHSLMTNEMPPEHTPEDVARLQRTSDAANQFAARHYTEQNLNQNAEQYQPLMAEGQRPIAGDLAETGPYQAVADEIFAEEPRAGGTQAEGLPRRRKNFAPLVGLNIGGGIPLIGVGAAAVIAHGMVDAGRMAVRRVRLMHLDDIPGFARRMLAPDRMVNPWPVFDPSRPIADVDWQVLGPAFDEAVNRHYDFTDILDAAKSFMLPFNKELPLNPAQLSSVGQMFRIGDLIALDLSRFHNELEGVANPMEAVREIIRTLAYGTPEQIGRFIDYPRYSQTGTETLSAWRVHGPQILQDLDSLKPGDTIMDLQFMLPKFHEGKEGIYTAEQLFGRGSRNNFGLIPFMEGTANPTNVKGDQFLLADHFRSAYRDGWQDVKAHFTDEYGNWRDEIPVAELDAILFAKKPEPIDLAWMFDRIGSRVAELEGMRLAQEAGVSFDEFTNLPPALKVMIGMKGAFSHLWMTYFPGYHIGNAFGNQMAQILGGLRRDTLYGLFPKEDAWLNRAMSQPGNGWSVGYPDVYRSKVKADLDARGGEIITPSNRRFEFTQQALPKTLEREGGPANAVMQTGQRIGRWMSDNRLGRFVDPKANWMENKHRQVVYSQETGRRFRREWPLRASELGMEYGLDEQEIASLKTATGMRDLREKVYDIQAKRGDLTLGDNELVTRFEAAFRGTQRAAEFAGEKATREALRDYRYRSRLDIFLDKFLPIHFWTTHNLAFTAKSVLHSPALMGGLIASLQRLHESDDDRGPYTRLREWTAPEWVPVFGGDRVGVRTMNLLNPAIVTALKLMEEEPATYNRYEDQGAVQRFAGVGGGGFANMWEAVGYRVSPHFEWGWEALQAGAHADQAWADGELRSQTWLPWVAKFANPIIEPTGFHPSFLPLGGLEQVPTAYSTHAQYANMWTRQLVYGKAAVTNYQARQLELTSYAMHQRGDLTDDEYKEAVTALHNLDFTNWALLKVSETLQRNNAEHSLESRVFRAPVSDDQIDFEARYNDTTNYYRDVVEMGHEAARTKYAGIFPAPIRALIAAEWMHALSDPAGVQQPDGTYVYEGKAQDQPRLADGRLAHPEWAVVGITGEVNGVPVTREAVLDAIATRKLELSGQLRKDVLATKNPLWQWAMSVANDERFPEAETVDGMRNLMTQVKEFYDDADRLGRRGAGDLWLGPYNKETGERDLSKGTTPTLAIWFILNNQDDPPPTPEEVEDKKKKEDFFNLQGAIIEDAKTNRQKQNTYLGPYYEKINELLDNREAALNQLEYETKDHTEHVSAEANTPRGYTSQTVQVEGVPYDFVRAEQVLNYYNPLISTAYADLDQAAARYGLNLESGKVPNYSALKYQRTPNQQDIISLNNADVLVNREETKLNQKQWIINQLLQDNELGFYINGEKNPRFWDGFDQDYQALEMATEQYINTKLRDEQGDLRILLSGNGFDLAYQGVITGEDIWQAVFDEMVPGMRDWKTKRDDDFDTYFKMPTYGDSYEDSIQLKTEKALFLEYLYRTYEAAYTDHRLGLDGSTPTYGPTVETRTQVVTDEDGKQHTQQVQTETVSAEANERYNEAIAYGGPLKQLWQLLTPRQQLALQGEMPNAFDEDGNFRVNQLTSEQVDRLLTEYAPVVNELQKEERIGTRMNATYNLASGEALDQLQKQNRVDIVQSAYYAGAGLTTEEQERLRTYSNFKATNEEIYQRLQDERKTGGLSWKQLRDQYGADSEEGKFITEYLGMLDAVDPFPLFDKQADWINSQPDADMLKFESPTLAKAATKLDSVPAQGTTTTEGGTPSKTTSSPSSTPSSRPFAGGGSSGGGGYSSSGGGGSSASPVYESQQARGFALDIYAIDPVVSTGRGADYDTRRSLIDQIVNILLRRFEPLLGGFTDDTITQGQNYLTMMLVNRIKRKVGKNPTVESWQRLLAEYEAQWGDPNRVKERPEIPVVA